MWTKELLGTDVYHLVSAFIIYSMAGWLVESIYMSFCNKKITNRGFARGPFCPIYGFGAVIGYHVLHLLGGNPFLVYIAGAVLATIFEFLVGKLMIQLLGELWWDYTNKPFNYKGIICLESTVAWGFYAIIIVFFLNNQVMKLVDKCDMRWGTIACILILLAATTDYIFRLLEIFDISLKEKKDKIVDIYHSVRARW